MNFIHTFTSSFNAKNSDKQDNEAIKDPKEPQLIQGFYVNVDYKCPNVNCLLFSPESALLLEYSGNNPNDFISTKSYYAMNYGGCQFGVWNGQLGDGRVLHHGDVRNTKGQIWDISIKGTGKTPFSRYGDGLQTLKSALREYLGLEYLAALGIPTTRALALYSTGQNISRKNGQGEKESIGPGGNIF